MADSIEAATADDASAKPLRVPPLEFLVLAAAVVVACYVRIRLLDMPLERDEGGYAYGAWRMVEGDVLYRDIVSMRFPGIFFIYALGMSVFGYTTAGIHLLLLFANLASAAFVWLLGRAWYDLRTACLAASGFLLLSMSSATLGVTANNEHFVVLYALAALVALSYCGKRWLLGALLAGMLMAWTLLVKHHGALLIAYGGLTLGMGGLGDASLAGLERLKAVGAYCIGCAAVLLSALVFISSQGAFERFTFWTLEYASTYGSSVTLSQAREVLSQILPRILAVEWPFWLLALMGLVPIKIAAGRGQSTRGLAILLATLLLMTSLGLYFRPHYFLYLHPALAILAARRIASFSLPGPIGRRGAVVSTLVFVAAAGTLLVQDRAFLFQLTPPAASRALYGPNPFVEAPAIAEYIARHTGPGARVAVMGSEPEILFYARRESATSFTHVYPLMEAHAFARELQEQAIGEIEEASPEMIVFVSVAPSWLIKNTSDWHIIEWLQAYAAQHYRIVGIVDVPPKGGIGEFYWDAEAARRAPQSDHYIIIYQRKT